MEQGGPYRRFRSALTPVRTNGFGVVYVSLGVVPDADERNTASQLRYRARRPGPWADSPR